MDTPRLASRRFPSSPPWRPEYAICRRERRLQAGLAGQSCVPPRVARRTRPRPVCRVRPYRSGPKTARLKGRVILLPHRLLPKRAAAFRGKRERSCCRRRRLPSFQHELVRDCSAATPTISCLTHRASRSSCGRRDTWIRKRQPARTSCIRVRRLMGDLPCALIQQGPSHGRPENHLDTRSD